MIMKILVLGGGQAQIGLIRTARNLGLEVIVVGIEGHYPGYLLANKVIYEDVFDKDAVLRVARAEKVDGIAMCCTDFGLQTIGYVNDQLCLCGINEQCAIDSSDKLRMKEKLKAYNVNTANYILLKNDDDINKAVAQLSFPLIVKAVDLQGSRGIYKCNSIEELKNCYVKSIEESRHDYCIVEEYIEGNEFGAQAFVQDGEVLFVLPHGDEVLKQGQTNIPIGHYIPLEGVDKTFKEKVCDLVEKAIKAMGFNNCAVNVDLIEKDGEPYIIELTGRAGANSLPELISEYLGINYYELILRNACGESIKNYLPKKIDKKKTVVSRQLFSTISGRVVDISFPKVADEITFSLFLNKGDDVHKFRNSNDCVGRLILSGETKKECDDAYDEFMRKFKIEILPPLSVNMKV